MDQNTVSVLKADSLGRVERLERGDERRLRRVAIGGRWPGSGVLARLLLRRERKALEQLQGLPGIPRLLGPDWAESVPGADGTTIPAASMLVREFVDGTALHQATHLPENFFERLDELVLRMHERGICHNDLHKEQNVMVTSGGFPALIDFQLASCHARRGRTYRVRCHEDRRHVRKHERRYRRAGRPVAEAGDLPEHLPRKPLSRLWRATGKRLYHGFTRRVLRRWDGEPRRDSKDAWPRWGPPLPPWP
ncbi:MAG: phosphotransferase [Planctomycetota bacterium]